MFGRSGWRRLAGVVSGAMTTQPVPSRKPSTKQPDAECAPSESARVPRRTTAANVGWFLSSSSHGKIAAIPRPAKRESRASDRGRPRPQRFRQHDGAVEFRTLRGSPSCCGRGRPRSEPRPRPCRTLIGRRLPPEPWRGACPSCATGQFGRRARPVRRRFRRARYRTRLRRRRASEEQHRLRAGKRHVVKAHSVKLGDAILRLEGRALEERLQIPVDLLSRGKLIVQRADDDDRNSSPFA